MKQTLMFLVLTTFLFACGSSNSPAGVAENFVVNISQGNFEEAKKYASPEAASILSLAAGFAEEMPDYSDYKFKIVDESIDGDTAKIKYVNPEGKEEELDLKKIDGEWKVYIKK